MREKDDSVSRLRAHFGAARRLTEAARADPKARAGFLKAARLNVAKAATLAEDICGGARRETGAAPHVLPGRVKR